MTLTTPRVLESSTEVQEAVVEEKKMEERGYREDVLLLHSGGGVMTAAGAKKFPARMSASGIAAGAIASRFIARLVGFENSISLDMGGTSTDISLVDRGELPITNDWPIKSILGVHLMVVFNLNLTVFLKKATLNHGN